MAVRRAHRLSEVSAEPISAVQRWHLAQWFGLAGAGPDVYLDLHRLMAADAPLALGDRLAVVDDYLDEHGLRDGFERFARVTDA